MFQFTSLLHLQHKMSVTNTIGYLILLHAAYSSYEHHQVFKTIGEFPTDIILELVIGLLVVNFGTLDSLRYPKSRALDHGHVVENKHKYLKPIEISKAMVSVNELGATEFEYLDTRLELVDLQAKRQEYANWKKSG